jgi:hypothetical protein
LGGQLVCSSADRRYVLRDELLSYFLAELRR